MMRSYNWTSSPISGTSWTHHYAVEGTYSVNVTCYNNVSVQSVVVLQYVQAAIVNLRLLRNGALVVSDARVTHLLIVTNFLAQFSFLWRMAEPYATERPDTKFFWSHRFKNGRNALQTWRSYRISGLAVWNRLSECSPN